MKEDEMNDLIRDTARESYNAPPEPPRDEMWARIRAARRAQPGTGSDDATPTTPSDAGADAIPMHGRAWRWGWRALPIAALLLLSFGLGRLSLLYERGASVGSPRTAATSPSASVPGPAGVSEPAPAPAQATPQALAAREPAESAPQGVPLLRGRSAAGAPASSPRTGNGSIYRFAAAQTLGQAELLLTSFRAETRAGGSVDPQVAEWAGEVLSSTRLLLDSPAGRDPKLRGLLEDVELVLAQIVQLRSAPAASTPGDANLIDHALQQRDLLPRLRTAVPAGAPIGT